MTLKQPAASAKDVVRVAEQLGFLFRRQTAVMPFTFARADQVRVVISMHKGELKRKTLRGVIQDLKISVE